MRVGALRRCISIPFRNLQLEERNAKKALINRLLPLSALAAFGINAATGGALGKIEVGLPGPGPPGMAEARELKAKSAAKSKANYQKLAGKAE